eukprot:jgi/Bigna1/84250/fgenesh1_pg.127_\
MQIIVLTLDESVSKNSIGLATRKPQMVLAAMKEFSKPEYCADVLKMEFPVVASFVKGLKAAENRNNKNNHAYDIDEAKGYMKAMSDASKGTPFIFLSAGVDMDVFLEMLQLAGEAGCEYSGVLCGRATWKGAIDVYAKNGAMALEEWVKHEGCKNLEKLSIVLRKHATSIKHRYSRRQYIGNNNTQGDSAIRKMRRSKL